jgi:hypothetical protein
MSWQLVLNDRDRIPEGPEAEILDRAARAESEVRQIQALILADAPFPATSERIERACSALASLKVLLGQREMGRLFHELHPLGPARRRPPLGRRRRRRA